MTGHPTDLPAYLAFLERAGVRFDVSPDLVRDPDQPGRPHADPEPLRDLALAGLPVIREHRDPARSVSACHATVSVARAMAHGAVVRRGEPFWDVGCGTGVLAIAAALLGAHPVLATDIDPGALELARRNVAAARVAVEVAESSLLDHPGGRTTAGLVAMNLPHKPSIRRGSLPLSQDGGPEGDDLFAAALDQTAQRLAKGTRLLFFLHSLPHPRLLVGIGEAYHLTLLSWKRRFLEPGEYGPLQEWFVARHGEGTSWVGTTADGSRFLVCGIWLAEPRSGSARSVSQPT